jgi:hypothetical protein
MLKAIQLGQQLTKKEMKEVTGGGTCCAHSDAGYESCGLSKGDAIKYANQYASQTGNRHFGAVLAVKTRAI